MNRDSLRWVMDDFSSPAVFKVTSPSSMSFKGNPKANVKGLVPDQWLKNPIGSSDKL